MSKSRQELKKLVKSIDEERYGRYPNPRNTIPDRSGSTKISWNESIEDMSKSMISPVMDNSNESINDASDSAH